MLDSASVILQSTRWRHYVLDAFVRLFVCLVCYQTCEHDILKTNELTDANWHKWSMEQGHETIILGLRRSIIIATRSK